MKNLSWILAYLILSYRCNILQIFVTASHARAVPVMPWPETPARMSGK